MYRKSMNDEDEFNYAKNVVYEALNRMHKRSDLPPIALRMTMHTRKYLDQLLKDTNELSRSYCACFTISSDHPKQWKTYANKGRGFAIGFDLARLLSTQAAAVQQGISYIFCAPVIYNKSDQHELVWRLMDAGIWDLKKFAETCSQESEDLTEFYNRVIKEIVVQLLVLIDFIKSPCYRSEKEYRLIQDSNDGTLKALGIQQHESKSFIFMDLRMSNTKRLPLKEIRVGPKASLQNEKTFLEVLLNDLGYGGDYEDRPVITQSIIKMVGSS